MTSRPNYNEVLELKFLTAIEDLSRKLQDELPEFHINVMQGLQGEQYYHIFGYNPAKPNNTGSYVINQAVFAYSVPDGKGPDGKEKRKYYLYNESPLRKL